MSCENHKKEVAGISDMKELAEQIGDLHYKSLSELLKALSQKMKQDSRRDWENGKTQLAARLKETSILLKGGYVQINEAWQISRPFMPKP